MRCGNYVKLILGFPGDSEGKASACNEGDPVRSLGQEDPLEEGMATHCSILAWRIPWTEEPGGLQSVGSQSRTRLSDVTFFRSLFTLPGAGSPSLGLAHPRLLSAPGPPAATADAAPVCAPTPVTRSPITLIQPQLHSLGRGQGRCQTARNAQGSPHHLALWDPRCQQC